ncbi:hypothetical protein N7517_003003 [Penicillium concentricum]|uniref:Uncharacterized protein n=1 Tax=Penicillium concentricum TaxID=293559 RepID=A0A9W9VKC0_9EURO|nr:uncharacterized protein N7517_003003 [Penicillium concentricum]KAJ5385092.1 hypothetical protein N7517_003003 [Penicillium concentricum]
MQQERPGFCPAPTITWSLLSARTRVGLGAAKTRLSCSGARCSFNNVAPGSQQLHRSVAAPNVARSTGLPSS